MQQQIQLQTERYELQQPSSEFDKLIRKDNTFSELLKRNARSLVVRRPPHLLPSREWVVNHIFHECGYYPPPNLEIEHGTLFINTTVPTTGKFYFRCFFHNCEFEVETDRWGMAKCLRLSREFRPIYMDHNQIITHNLLR